ncbi:hypothetical protein G6F56_008489 [Rhizopus delemar]|nr:hypothetical protein G6F56_008489 [Rhizopus delemar]
MNRLGFADFHAKHFSQEQQDYWRSFVQQQQYYQNIEEQSDCDHDKQQYNDDQQYEEIYIQEADQEEIEIEDENYDDYYFSKEAMEIFEFSEAFRKERLYIKIRCQEEKRREEEEEEKGKRDWIFDESKVLYSGGVEAPATCLVLTKATRDKPDKLRMKEDLLNSAYVSSCSDKDESTPVVFWPVIPLQL